MLKGLKGERGSYTLEACISLMAMVIAVAFVYSQIKVVICESIMQRAVDNMALEVSSYVYILDKAGLVIHANKNTLKGSNEIAYNGSEAVKAAISARDTIAENTGSVTDLLGLLDNTEGSAGAEVRKDGANMVASMKKILDIAKTADWGTELKQGAALTADGLVTVLADSAMNAKGGFYDWKLDAYLPCERSKFCKEYFIDPDSISFEYSRVFPGAANNTILVAVKYETTSPFSMFPIKRTVVKQAYTAAWLADPGNG